MWSLTSSFRCGAWSRLGLWVGSLVPSFVSWCVGSSSVELSSHWMSDFQYFSLLVSFTQSAMDPWLWSIVTSGTCANSSTRLLTMVSLFVVYGCPFFLVLLQHVVSIRFADQSESGSRTAFPRNDSSPATIIFPADGMV